MIYNIEVETKSPLLIGSNSGSDVWSKDIAMKKNLPIIPGSAIKGALREVSPMLSEYVNEVNSLFGDSENQGKLIFTELSVKTPGDSNLFIERTHISMDRKTRTVCQKKLFKVRAVNTGVKFQGKVFTVSPLTSSEERILLLLLSLTKKLGSKKSAGYGFIDIRLTGKVEKSSIKNIPQARVAQIICEPMEPFLVTSERTKSYLYNSAKYIPGSTLRGAYAARLSKDTKDFKEIFLLERVKFPNLYPMIDDAIAYPSPDSILRAKYSEDSDEIFDQLRTILISSIENSRGKKLSVKNARNGKRLDRAGKWYVLGTGVFDSGKGDTSTQVSLDSKLRSAKDGSLRTYNTYFHNKMSGLFRSESESLLSMLNEDWLYIGNSKTRGFGLVRVVEIKKYTIDLSAEIRSFNDSIQIAVSGKDRTYVPILLTSDLILRKGENIEMLLGNEFKLTLSLLKTSHTSGWSSASNNLKPFQNVVSAGTVLIYDTDLSVEESVETVEELYIKGLGKFTGSGYGQFVIYK